MLKKFITGFLFLFILSSLYSVAAISKIQNAQATTTGASPRVRAWDAGPTEGNLLIAIAYGNTDESNASIAGWSMAISAEYAGVGPKNVAIFYKIAGAGEGNVTLVWTDATACRLMIEEWTGFDPTPLDKTAFSNNVGAVEFKTSGTTANTTVDDELCIAAFMHGANVTNVTYTNLYNAEYDDGDCHFASLIVSSTGAQETRADWTTARITGGCIATFKGEVENGNGDEENAIFFGINFLMGVLLL